MFSLRTLVILCIYVAVLYFGKQLQTRLASRPEPLSGLILPIIAGVVAMGMSFNNFWISFYMKFSIYAFIASVALFCFFAVPAIYFSLLYVEGRKVARQRKIARDGRTRQVRTQKRLHNDMQRRYDDEKYEPLVYMPSSRSSRNTSNPRTNNRNTTSQRSNRSAKAGAQRQARSNPRTTSRPPRKKR